MKVDDFVKKVKTAFQFTFCILKSGRTTGALDLTTAALTGISSCHTHPEKAFLTKYIERKSIGHQTDEYRRYSRACLKSPLSSTNANNKNMHKINDAHLSAFCGWRIVQDIVDDGWQTGLS